jgi:hypothetical protein
VYLGGITDRLAYVHHLSTKAISAHFDEHITTTAFDMNFHAMMDTVYPIRPRHRFFYTAIAYMLSSEAAQRLVSLIDEYGFVAGNDEVAIKLFDMIPGCYVAHPLLVYVSTSSDDSRIHSEDTDIQDNVDPVAGAPLKSGMVDLWLPCK